MWTGQGALQIFSFFMTSEAQREYARQSPGKLLATMAEWNVHVSCNVTHLQVPDAVIKQQGNVIVLMWIVLM